MPKVREVHVDAALSNFAIGYHPTGFVAEQVVPPLTVTKESDVYYVWDRSSAHKVIKSDGSGSLRSSGTRSKTLSYNISTSPYQAEEYALKIRITDRERANQDSAVRLEQSKTSRVKDNLMLDQELRVSTLLTTVANYDVANTVTLSGADQWDDTSGSPTITIEKDIDTGKEAVRKAIGMEPDMVIIPSAVAKVVKRDSDIRELIKYTHKDLLVDGDLPPMLWGMKVVIPKSVFTVSKEGDSTPTFTDVWDDDVVLVWTGAGKPSIDQPTFAKMFRAQNFRVKKWRKEEISSDYIEVSHIQDEVITSDVSAYLIKDVLE